MGITAPIFFLILFAALLHASWNALIKRSAEPYLAAISVALGAALVSAALLPFLPQPAEASWPFILISGAFEAVFFVLIGTVYRYGEMSFGYPLMRGLAPLLVAIVSQFALREPLSAPKWIAVLLICGGVLSLALDRRRTKSAGRRHLAAILAAAFMIAGFTLIDGLGARRSGAAPAYLMWVYVVMAAFLLLWFALRRPAASAALSWKKLPLGLLGGACTLACYGLVVWAMTRAPIALVAALRETSIIFATAIAALFLRERATWRRFLATGCIASGAILIRIL